MNGAEAVLTSLKNEGVDVVFGYPGGAVLTLYDAVYKMKFPHILTRHEQGAVHAADGYARATGKVGVVFATSGPGATNLVTGISTAYTDSVPLVCITGQVANSYIGKDSFQEADVCGITTPITKHNYLVKKVEDLPRVLKEAFYIARTGRPGPVVIDVAKDVFDTKFDYAYPDSVHLRGYSGENVGDEREIDAVVEAIRRAKKPLVFVGGGVILSETAGVLQDIVRRLGAPSTATLLGLGAIPADEKGFLSFAGMHGSYGANMAIQECDLLLCIGMRFSDRVTGKVSEFAPHAKIVHFEIDRAELNKNVKVDYRVLGDLSWSLPLLRDKLAACPDDFVAKFAPWLAHALELEAKHPFGYREEGDAIKPGALISKVSSLMGRDAIGVTDVGQHQMWAAQFFKVYKPRHFLTSGGQGTMGYGLPAALGAKVGCPDSPVVLFSGDGSIMMNCQEFATLHKYGVDVKTIVLHNNVLGMVNQWQRLFYNGHCAESLIGDNPDLTAVSASMGVPGTAVHKPEDLAKAVEALFKTEGPALLDVFIPADENVYPMVPGGKRLDQMVLGGEGK